MLAKPSLTLRRRLKASPQRVFAAWTDAAQMVKWMSPAHCVTLSAEADARVGGRFRVIMRDDSGEIHDVSGRYLEVETDRKLVFTWAWITTPERESRVTVTLRPDGDGTVLTLLHEMFFDEAARDGHEHGWTGALDKLEAFVG